MFTGKMTTRGGLHVTAALGTKQLRKKVPVAPGSNRRGVAKGQGDGAHLPPCIYPSSQEHGLNIGRG